MRFPTRTLTALNGAMSLFNLAVWVAFGHVQNLAGCLLSAAMVMWTMGRQKAALDELVRLSERMGGYDLCSYCLGNDLDMPCAYPSEGKPGCLRDKRLTTRQGLPS